MLLADKILFDYYKCCYIERLSTRYCRQIIFETE